MMKRVFIVLQVFLCFCFVKTAVPDLHIVAIAEKFQPEIAGWFTYALREVQIKTSLVKLDGTIVFLDRENKQEFSQQLCAAFSKKPNLILDMTWASWSYLDDLVSRWDFPKINSVLGDASTVLDGLMQVLNTKNATDGLFIFQNEKVLDQALYRLLGKTVIRIMALDNFSQKIQSIKNMRPSPGFYIIMGPTDFIQDSYKLAVKNDLLRLPDRWVLAITDFRSKRLDISILKYPCTIINMAALLSCKLQELPYPCDEDDETLQFNAVLMAQMIDLITNIMLANDIISTKPIISCESDNSTESFLEMQMKINSAIAQKVKSTDSLFYWNEQKGAIYLKTTLELKVGGAEGVTTIAEWESSQTFKTVIQPPRRYFRIGTVESTPWTMWKKDPSTGKKLMTPQGEPLYEGYCIDLIKRLAEVMDFDYDIVTPKIGDFGTRHPNGSFDGIIGDLARGETDIAIASTIMTSEREEVVDFVAPYFEQTGLSIVMRKPLRKTSLFKFMTVLRVEVWLSILAALSVTAILLAILDRYSPYSARNNKKAYPYPCRDFTLKESFWFALTSFTPQGGGEAPKSLSGRVLVAAYWLFVVLMLATFTANLAAFLTVERMQTPVSSLEQLARQSRINYTVVEGETAHQYFINMKFAEDTLYRVWKEITLNSTDDQHKYQVWDYPIREQYGHILLAINGSQPFKTSEEGFQTVNEHEDADFAFIHDSSRIKYEMTKNCNLTMVGDVFGERPYAIAVQQGSHLQEEVSKALLRLQTERFLESLTAKYWNNTCSNSEDSEGITLDSLGGVFIATLFGLALAMVTLAWEVLYYKRKERKSKVESENTTTFEKKLDNWMSTKDDNITAKVKKITIGDSFKPVRGRKKSKISFINPDPKIPWNP